jgi:glutathionylspermidine synthase
MNKVELKDLVGGALQEKFGKAFERVIENLQDQNTSFKVKRGITVKLDFTQNEARDDVQVTIDVVEKLAPQAGMKTSFYIGKDLKTGELFAEEYGKQVKGQMSLNDYQQPPVQQVDCEVVDTETGEIIENKEQIVDFRRVASV